MDNSKGMIIFIIVCFVIILMINLIFYCEKSPKGVPQGVPEEVPEEVPEKKQKVNCQVSEWGKWGECQDGFKKRSREIIVEPFNDGDVCPILTETQSCSNILNLKINRQDGNERIIVQYTNKDGDVKELKSPQLYGENREINVGFEIKDSIKSLIIKYEKWGQKVKVNEIKLNGTIVYNESQMLEPGKDLILEF